MRCRMFFLLLMGLLLSNTTYANGGNKKVIEGIIVNTYKEHWSEKGTRSIPFIPIITQEGSFIRIYFDIDLLNLQITVKDASGTIVYLDTVSVSDVQSCSFQLEELMMEDGEYIIELVHGEKYLYGYFSINP